MGEEDKNKAEGDLEERPDKITDMTEAELKRVERYRKQGLPGIGRANESTMFQMFNLYLSGKTYDEISHITKEKKDVVLFLAHKLDWFGKKIEYLSSLNKNITSKVAKTKLEGVNFVTNLMNFFHKYYGKKINEYLMKDDDKLVEELPLKPLDKYFKAAEALDKLMPKGKEENGGGYPPFTEIHLQGNAEITQESPNKLMIKSDPNEQLVSALARWKRDMEGDK